MRRLTASYNNRGLPELLTSWSTTSGSTSTDIVNQVQQDYNDFTQLTGDWQEHGGAVDTAAGAGQSLRVQYAYASGLISGSPSNFIRPTELTYPDGRTIVYTYGGNAAIDYHINRMKTIKEGSTTGDGLVQYVFLGMGRYVRANYWIPETRLDLWGGTVGTYSGLDRFNRPTNCKWIDTGANPDVDIVDLEYGYNRNSIPTYRADDLAASSDNYDELYGRDGLDRLDNFQRGTLNAGKTAITTLAFEQDWSLDQVANWDAFNEDANGDGTDNLVQTRTHNFSNEVTGVTNTTGGAWNAPTYDSAGNTTQCPAPDDPSTSTSDRKLTYDAWNRLVKATDNQGTPATLAEYAYDARGFRVLRKGYTSGTHDATHHDYFTTGWQCIEERLDDPSNGDPPALDRQYVWGTRYVDELVQRKRDTTGNGVLNEELYAMNDRQFNVVGLTDETGAVVQRMTLTAYGEVTFLTSSYGSSTNTKDWRHVFQGLRTDDGTGFICNRERILHPVLGRFLQRDLLGYPDGMNAYAAYHVMWGALDPTGKEIEIREFTLVEQDVADLIRGNKMRQFGLMSPINVKFDWSVETLAFAIPCICSDDKPLQVSIKLIHAKWEGEINITYNPLKIDAGTEKFAKNLPALKVAVDQFNAQTIAEERRHAQIYKMTHFDFTVFGIGWKCGDDWFAKDDAETHARKQAFDRMWAIYEMQTSMNALLQDVVEFLIHDPQTTAGLEAIRDAFFNAP